MRILFVNFTKFWGGGESWSYIVMDELRKRDHNVMLLSNTESKLRLHAEKNNFETHTLSVNKFSYLNICNISRTKKKLTEIKPDVIILNSTWELKIIGLGIKAYGNPKVIFTRNIPSPIKLRLTKRYMFAKVVSDVIVNSHVVRESVSNLTKYLKDKPQVIYHGITHESTISSEGITKNIAIVGRLSPEKGVDIALQVIQKVLTQQPDAKLWIVGEGKERKNLIRITSELGIQDSVVFHGFASGSEVENLMAQCSMLIMTSRWEGFGLVLLEAMKLRMPCIAFDHLAANEIIVDNKTGFLIPDSNIDFMADKINHLLSNPATCQLMGKNGNDLLKQKFSIKESIDGYEKLIRRD
jgi:glycosyltransferase involved in cell wall biosynthesis